MKRVLCVIMSAVLIFGALNGCVKKPTESVLSEKSELLVPFVAGKTTIDPVTGYSMYGLCTLDGEVVDEPIYSNCRVIDSGEDALFYWMTYSPENPEEYDPYDEYASVLIKSDGSQRIELTKGASAYVFGDEERILICEYPEGEQAKMSLYDMNSTLIYSDDNTSVVGAVSDGLIHYDIIDENQNSIDNYYIDFNGYRVIDAGTDLETGNFNDGLVSTHDKQSGLWGYLDRTGQYAIDPQFDWAGDFENGYAVATLNGKQVIIDKSGNSVLSKDYGYIYLTEFENVFTVGYKDFYFIDSEETVTCPTCGALAKDGVVTWDYVDYSDCSYKKDGYLFHEHCKSDYSSVFIPGGECTLVDRETVELVKQDKYSLTKDGKMTLNDGTQQNEISQTVYEFPIADGKHVFFNYYGEEMDGGTVKYYICDENGTADVKFSVTDSFDLIERQKIGGKYYYLFIQNGFSGVKDEEFEDILKIETVK